MLVRPLPSQAGQDKHCGFWDELELAIANLLPCRSGRTAMFIFLCRTKSETYPLCSQSLTSCQFSEQGNEHQQTRQLRTHGEAEGACETGAFINIRCSGPLGLTFTLYAREDPNANKINSKCNYVSDFLLEAEQTLL